MQVESITPILNVSDLAGSFAWFEQFGWKKLWDWGNPPTFGAVSSGKCEIFLCKNAQGARGGNLPKFEGDDNTGAVWMSWWVPTPADVDAAYALAIKNGMTVTRPPKDETWGVRECHIRHPDGHTFRVGAGINECNGL
jgi:catechol 2,3-dioxygenase-like lactoylglutathione lyase family enzyme